MKLIHKNTFVSIIKWPDGKWLMVMYDSKFNVLHHYFYAYKQSAIRFAEKKLY